MQALRERAGSLERAAPRCSPQIQAQRSRIEASWERLDQAVKARTQVGALGPVGADKGQGQLCLLPGPGPGKDEAISLLRGGGSDG